MQFSNEQLFSRSHSILFLVYISIKHMLYNQNDIFSDILFRNADHVQWLCINEY